MCFACVNSWSGNMDANKTDNTKIIINTVKYGKIYTIHNKKRHIEENLDRKSNESLGHHNIIESIKRLNGWACWKNIRQNKMYKTLCNDIEL